MFETFPDSESPTTDSPRIRVSLRLYGDTLDPDFLTQHLGIAPTFSAMKGDPGEREGDDQRDTGMWIYRLDGSPGTELGDVIEGLLARFPDDSTLWEELSASYTVEVACAVFLESANQRTAIATDVLERLGRLLLPLNLDLFAPTHSVNGGDPHRPG